MKLLITTIILILLINDSVGMRLIKAENIWGNFKGPRQPCGLNQVSPRGIGCYYTIDSRGPCPPNHVELMEPPNGVMKCTSQNTVAIVSLIICGKGSRMVMHDGSYKCSCDQGRIFYSKNKSCYAQGTQGPCPKGQSIQSIDGFEGYCRGTPSVNGMVMVNSTAAYLPPPMLSLRTHPSIVHGIPFKEVTSSPVVVKPEIPSLPPIFVGNVNNNVSAGPTLPFSGLPNVADTGPVPEIPSLPPIFVGNVNNNVSAGPTLPFSGLPNVADTGPVSLLDNVKSNTMGK